MPINRAFQRLKKPMKDGFHAVCKPSKCEGLVRMFLRFRFRGIVCCVLYRFSFPQSDL